MPDSPPVASSQTSPRPAPSSQSPPPGARIEALVGGPASYFLPPVEELLRLLLREIELRAAKEPALTAELRVRAALLWWDGRGRSDEALRLLGGAPAIDHPVATALRLQAAIDAPDNAALLHYADEVQRRGESDEVAEVGELLLWRGEPARAAMLLERDRAGDRSRHVRALALGLSGRWAEAVEVLSATGTAQALLQAAHLSEDRLSDQERARALLRRALDRPGLGVTEQVRLVERLLDLEGRRTGDAQRIELLRLKLELWGGLRRLEVPPDAAAPSAAAGVGGAQPGEAPGAGGPPGEASCIEVLLTAVLLSHSLERTGTPASLSEAAATMAVVGRYCAAHPDTAAQLAGMHVLRSRARVETARGNYREAALLWQELGQKTAALPGAAESTEPMLRAGAMAYTRRAAELWDARVSDGFERARDLYQGLLEQDPTDGTLALNLSRLLLQRGEPEAAAVALDRHAQAVGQQAPGELIRAGRAAEAVRSAHAIDSAQRSGAPFTDSAQRSGAPFTESAQRSGAPSTDSAQRSAAPSIESAQRSGAPFTESAQRSGAPSIEQWLEEVTGDRPGLEALCRLHRRRGDRPRLVAVYRRLGALAAEGQSPLEARRAATYLSVAAALALEALPTREAEALLVEATPRPAAGEGEAPLLHALTQVVLYRRQGRAAELAATLKQLLDRDARIAHPATRAELWRQLGRLAAEQLGQVALARQAYERVLELLPEDVVALHALSRLLVAEPDGGATSGSTPAAGGLLRALRLLRQAVELSIRDQATPRLPAQEALVRAEPGQAGPQAAAVLLCEMAGLYLDPRLGEEDQALRCYEEALSLDGRCRAAAAGLIALHRAARRLDALQQSLERALTLARDDAARLDVLLQLAACAEAQAGTDGSSPPDAPSGAYATRAAERALEAYAAVLELKLPFQAQQEQALHSLVRLCKRMGRSEQLCAAVEKAPRTAKNLRVLYEAEESLGRHAEAARHREEELDLLTEPREVLRAARALGDIYENRLQQPDAAARVWERAYQVDPGELLGVAAVPAALERLYAAQGRFEELSALLGRELDRLLHAERPDTSAAERAELKEQRRVLMLRLGGVQRDRLLAPTQALSTYEQVLRLFPQDPEALAALQALYTQEGRSDDVRRVLDVRAQSAQDPGERARVLLQTGELAEKGGDLRQAQQHYAEAFYADPANRVAFTSLERVCYRAEQWAEVMRMYNAALEQVEQHKSRAYRLGDLYARRGQVLLQYLQKSEEAAQNYLKALELDPDTDSNQSALERIYAAAQSWAQLIATYERRAQLVRDDGKRVEILRRAARVAAAKLRDIPEAIRLYQKLHAVDPTDSEALDALERHYERVKEHEKLISLLSTRLALSASEGESIALGLRIATLSEEGLRDHERAVEAYRQILELQPNHREALDGLARLFEATERWAELIEVTRRQIRLTTDRAQKALLYFKCGSVMEAKFAKEDDAIRYYEAAVKTSPSCLPAVHGLRDIYLRRQDWPRVTQTLELEAKLWTEDKERAGIYAHIGQIYRDKLHDTARAIQYYESALAVDKDCLPANRALFEVYYERGDWSRAVPMSQVLSAKVNREGEPSERSEFYRKRAIVAEHAADLRTAAESLVVALEIQPEHMAALELLVSLCRRDPGMYDFAATFRELEKLYRRRGEQRGLGLTLVARGTLLERSYDVEGAEALLKEAARLSPSDYPVIEALVALYERLRRFGDAREILEAFQRHQRELLPQVGREARIAEARALLRLAEMYSDAAMQPEPALAVLRELCTPAEGVAPEDGVPGDLLRIGRFRMIQELYLLGRYPEARTEMEALIETAVSPPRGAAPSPSRTEVGASAGSVAPPEELARYYDYLGRILEAQGTESAPAAQRSYRRATDLDPAYAPPVLALARRAAAAGDRAQAESLIREALQQARDRGDPQDELRLRRGVARLLANVDPAQAVDAYRQTIELATARLGPEEEAAARASAWLRGAGPDGGKGSAPLVARETMDDRVALADLLLQKDGGVREARDELQRVLLRDLRHAPAYKLLSQAYERLGEPERAARVQAALALLGYAETPGHMLPGGGLRLTGVRGTLSDELRASRLLLSPVVSPYQELLTAVADQLRLVFPTSWSPGDLELPEVQPASKLADAGFKLCLADVQRLYGLEVDVWVARGVPGGVLSLDRPVIHRDARGGAALLRDARHAAADGGPVQVILEAALLDRPDPERRFLLGRAIEPLRGGYATLLRLRPAEQREVGRLLDNLLRPEAERDAASQEFYASLSRKAARQVDKLLGAAPRTSVDIFFQALPLCADRAGLLCCDDIVAAVRMMARLQGEELASVEGASGAILLGQVQGGAEIVRYFLSDEYHEIREALKDATRL